MARKTAVKTDLNMAATSGVKPAAPVSPQDAASEAPFYIAATQPTTRPPRALKYGDTFVVIDSRGDIAPLPRSSASLFHCDTRYLSRLELRLNGMRPLLLGSNLRDDNSAFKVDLSNPDLIADQRVLLEKDTVHILRTIFVWRATPLISVSACAITAAVQSTLELSLLFANDRAPHLGVEPVIGLAEQAA